MPYSPMTKFSPFPVHVQSYLYSGKTVTLINQRGADVDMNSDVYRKVMETTESRMRERHFRYATHGTFAPSRAPPPKPRVRKRTRHISQQPPSAVQTGPVAADPPESSESETEQELQSPVAAYPLHPSQRLLDFLGTTNHTKAKSLHTLPKIRADQKVKSKPPLRQFFQVLRRHNQFRPIKTPSDASRSRKSMLPDSLLSATSL